MSCCLSQFSGQHSCFLFQRTHLQFSSEAGCLYEVFRGFPKYLQTDTWIHSFHWHVQNVTILCHSQELFLFFSVIYSFLPPFSTNYSSILPHFILPSISCLPLNLFVSKLIYTLLGILFSSILCTCPNQCNLTLLSLL